MGEGVCVCVMGEWGVSYGQAGEGGVSYGSTDKAQVRYESRLAGHTPSNEIGVLTPLFSWNAISFFVVWTQIRHILRPQALSYLHSSPWLALG